MNNINTASALPKLLTILEEDVSTLAKMVENKSTDTPLYKMIHSLISAKKHILNIIPENKIEVGESATPPQKNQPRTYYKNHKGYIKDVEHLPKIFLEIESEQSKFVRKMISQPGIPDNLNKKLYHIAEVYEKITTQLDNAVQRHQINEIVV